MMPAHIGIRRGRGPLGRIATSALAGDRIKEPQRLDELAAEMDRDYQVVLARRTLDARVQSIPITFSVDNGDQRAEALKDQLETLWIDSLTSALACIPEGRVAFEKVYGFDDNHLTVIVKLDALPFSKTEMMLADDGSFNGIKLKPNREDEITIQPEKSWWLALDATPLEPHGRSRYMGAPHATWKTRRELLKLRDKFIRRFALTNAVYRGPPTKRDEDGNLVDIWQKAGEAFDASRSGGLFIISNEWDAASNQWEEQFEEMPQPRDGSPIENSVDASDAEQIRAFGFSEKTVTEGTSVGSFAMVKEQVDLLDSVALGILVQIADSYQKYVIDKIVETNYGVESPVKIKLNYQSIREQVDSFMVDAVKDWLSSPELSPLILSGAVDVAELLRRVGIPVSKDIESRIEQMIATERSRAERASAAPVGGFFPRRLSRSLAIVPGIEANIPPQEQLVEESLSELDRLHAAIDRELSRLHQGENDDGTLELLVGQIRGLDADARVAARVIGMLSPWQDKLNEIFSGQRAASRSLSIAGIDNPFAELPAGETWRFSWIEEALRWLEERKVVTTGEFAAMAERDRNAVFTAAAVDDLTTVSALKDAVTDSLAQGESLATFRQRLGDEFGLDRVETETLYRTNTHRAYVQGQEQSLSAPVVADAFPFVMLDTTEDTRRRPTHRVMDGVVVKRGTPEHRVILNLLADWNCRCGPIPLSAEDAAGHKISTLTDIPPEVLVVYG